MMSSFGRILSFPVLVARGCYHRVCPLALIFECFRTEVDSESSPRTEVDASLGDVQPTDHVTFDVEIIATSSAGFTLRNRATRAVHTISFDSIVIGPNDCGDGYVLSLPRDRAVLQGMIDAA